MIELKEYLKSFNNHSDYETYVNSGDMVRPNVSLCVEENEMHYNPWYDPERFVAKFNVTNTTSPIYLFNNPNLLSKLEIDGVEYTGNDIFSQYYHTFSTTGIHTVKYTLTNGTTSINSSAFAGKDNMVSITIPDSITTIGFQTFGGCTGLTSINIPNNVTTISECPFAGCSGLTSITIPNNVTTIGGSLGNFDFENVIFESINSNATFVRDATNKVLTNIASDTLICGFNDTVAIPNTVTSIGNYAFGYCSSLMNITMQATTPPTLSSSSVFDHTNNCPIYVPAESVAAYKTVTNWSTYASRIRPIPYNDERLVIKFNATSTSSATKIISTSSAAAINQFTKIEIDGVEQPNVVSSYTFNTTGEHTVKYTLTNPTTIAQYTFQNCSNITSVVIGSSTTSIGQYAFNNCTNLIDIVIPDSFTTIDKQVFSGCTKLKNLILPNSLTSIGEYAFYNCDGLTSIVIPNNVTTIGQSVFSHCNNIVDFIIGSGVTSLGNTVFYNCDNATNITSLATTAPTITNNTFQLIKTGGTLYVPSGSTGYDVWMGTGDYYLGKYNWTKVEQ